MTEHHPGVRLLLLADPGLPTRRAERIQARLERTLDEQFSQPVALEARTETLRLGSNDELDLRDAERLARADPRPDAVLLITEIPRLTDRRPMVAELLVDRNVGIISCPTLGAAWGDARLHDAVLACAVRMKPQVADPDADPSAPRGLRWSRLGQDGDHVALLGHAASGGLRTIIGMVASNAPLRTAPQLSGALAAAAATGAFGIFYSSIWAMSLYLPTTRLLGIGALAITAMVAWLIVGNRLWDGRGTAPLARLVLLYNLSTVLTIALCVAGLYVALVVLILLGGLVVIAPEYMAEIIGQEPTFTNYLDIAWLSAAMGVVAGALGSSFDQRTDLRSMTHGQRERSRYLDPEEGADASAR